MFKYALRAEKMAASALRADSTLSPTLLGYRIDNICQHLNTWEQWFFWAQLWNHLAIGDQVETTGIIGNPLHFFVLLGV